MNKESLRLALESYNLHKNEEQLSNLEHLVDTTLKTNESFNLTAIKDKDAFYEKMVLDSALGLVDIPLKDKKVIDVGTGAGFPGMVLYILEPNMDLTLLDSTTKKINYLREYSKERNYKLSFSSERIEDYAKNHRESFDYAYARAVSSLNILVELIAPILKVGGYFIAMKGPGVEEEIKEAKNALKTLSLEIVEDKKYILPESKEERHILVIKKNKETSLKYPRIYSQIKKRPL